MLGFNLIGLLNLTFSNLLPISGQKQLNFKTRQIHLCAKILFIQLVLRMTI